MAGFGCHGLPTALPVDGAARTGRLSPAHGTQNHAWSSCLCHSIVVLAFACLIALYLAPARAADEPAADWSVGVATVKITPPKPVPLAGYAARTAPYERVDQDVYATALRLKDAHGGRAVLVTMDMCIFPREVGNPVRERIEKENHLDPAAVVLSISHSHSAPDVSLDPRPENAPPTTGPSTRAATAAATVEYTRWLQDRLVEVAARRCGTCGPPGCRGDREWRTSR